MKREMICTNNLGYENTLVVGKLYEILGEDNLGSHYLVKIEGDHPTWFKKSKFREVQEDIINKPEHYHRGGIDVLELIERKAPDKLEGFLMGNLWKYAIRYSEKGKPKEDLEKAEFYLKRLIELYDQKGDGNEQKAQG